MPLYPKKGRSEKGSIRGATRAYARILKNRQNPYRTGHRQYLQAASNTLPTPARRLFQNPLCTNAAPCARFPPRSKGMAKHPKATSERNIPSSIGCLTEEPEGNPTHVSANSSENDGGGCQDCHVVGPIARTQARPSLLSDRGARARERPPFRKVVRRSATHGISMKRQRGVTSASQEREPHRALA
jgi:hypothetical protein